MITVFSQYYKKSEEDKITLYVLLDKHCDNENKIFLLTDNQNSVFICRVMLTPSYPPPSAFLHPILSSIVFLFPSYEVFTPSGSFLEFLKVLEGFLRDP